jgi:hypothetical protein
MCSVLTALRLFARARYFMFAPDDGRVEWNGRNEIRLAALGSSRPYQRLAAVMSAIRCGAATEIS